jgi:hypothetical protein
LYNKTLRHRTPHNVTMYKNYKNMLTKIICNAERQYYRDQLRLNQNNLKKSWEIINQAINRKKKKRVKTEFISINNIKSSDPAEIAEYFNKYFTNIGRTLDKKILRTNTDPMKYIQNGTNNSIYLNPCSAEEILKIIKNLKRCAPGWDEIPAILIQENSNVVSNCLTHIINQSFIQGVFPKELKIAILIPIFKAGDIEDVGNFRPISLLPAFSKNFERVFYTRLIDFLKKYKLLYDLQFGFREQYSTQMAIITLIDKIISSLEKGNFTIGIFLDFSKAFDTVNHEILLTKLTSYGIRGIANNWVRNYLQYREQYCL